MRKSLLTLLTALALSVFTGCGSDKEQVEVKKSVLQEDLKEVAVDTKVNSAPVATFDTLRINRNTTYDGQLTATDADGDVLKYVVVEQPKHGRVVVDDNGCFTYTPNAGYKGDDTFSYKASDDISSCTHKTVRCNVCEEPIQTPTPPTNLQVTALSTTKFELTWSDNSNNEEGFVIYQDGRLVGNTCENKTKKIICCGIKAGTTYNFEVRAKNLAGTSAPASAQGTTPEVTSPPLAPTELKAKCIGKTSLRLTWVDNADNESFYEVYQKGIKIKTISNGCHSVVVCNLEPCTTYTFVVRAVNKKGFTESNTISVETECDIPVNTPPVADAGTNQNVNKGDTVMLDGSGSSDADGDTLSYAWSFNSKPAGSIAAFSNATLVNPTFTADVEGNYILKLIVNDGMVDSVADFVTITATTPNKPPVGIDDTAETDAGVSVNIPVLTNDTDVDIGDTLSIITSPIAPVNGTAVINVDGVTIDYTPNLGFDGTDTFTYMPNDGTVDGSVATVTVTVNKVCTPLHKTGQIVSYDTDGDVVGDGSVKDDGFYKKGATRSYTRDTDKEIVTDHVTGLMWQDDADATNVTKQWLTDDDYDECVADWGSPACYMAGGDTAMFYCYNLTLGGYTDWWLPRIEELVYLTDKGRTGSAIDPKFENVASSYYWSSTTYEAATYGAWSISFNVGNDRQGAKSNNNYVRCVRDGN